MDKENKEADGFDWNMKIESIEDLYKETEDEVTVLDMICKAVQDEWPIEGGADDFCVELGTEKEKDGSECITIGYTAKGTSTYTYNWRDADDFDEDDFEFDINSDELCIWDDEFKGKTAEDIVNMICRTIAYDSESEIDYQAEEACERMKDIREHGYYDD